MAAAGYDVASGDLWAMNEVPSAVRQNAGQSRRNLLDFLRGLYEGDASTGSVEGHVFVVGLGQRTQNLSVYLGEHARLAVRRALLGRGRLLRAVLGAGDLRRRPGVGRRRRASHDPGAALVEYLMHPLNLARAGGERTAAAEAFFRRDVSPARERRLEVALGVRVHGHRPSRDAALPVRAGACDPARRRDEARRRPERPPRLRLGAGERAERTGLPREDGGSPAAPGIRVRQRLRAGRRLADGRLWRARRPRLVRGRRRRGRVQRGVERRSRPGSDA